MTGDQPSFDAAWRAACRVKKVGRDAVDHMIKRHYLHCWPGVAVCILALEFRERPVGVLVYALPPRETSKRYGGVTWELARLWIEDAIPRNAETFFIAQSVKFVRRNFPAVQILVSYADPSRGHAGIVYKAANWTADGRTDQERKTPRFDYRDARTGKKYSRRSHVPIDAVIERVPRVSKWRFFYRVRP